LKSDFAGQTWERFEVRFGVVRVALRSWTPVTYVVWVGALLMVCFYLGNALIARGVAVHHAAQISGPRTVSRVEQQLLAQVQFEEPQPVRPPVFAVTPLDVPVTVLAVQLDNAETVKRPVVHNSAVKKHVSASTKAAKRRATQKLAQAKAAKIAQAKIAKDAEVKFLAFLGEPPRSVRQRKKYLKIAAAADGSTRDITNRTLGVIPVAFE
jgi:hypothetical protein